MQSPLREVTLTTLPRYLTFDSGLCIFHFKGRRQHQFADLIDRLYASLTIVLRLLVKEWPKIKFTLTPPTMDLSTTDFDAARASYADVVRSAAANRGGMRRERTSPPETRSDTLGQIQDAMRDEIFRSLGIPAEIFRPPAEESILYGSGNEQPLGVICANGSPLSPATPPSPIRSYTTRQRLTASVRRSIVRKRT